MGNVSTLLQDYGASSAMGTSGQQYKRLDYQYDLISGKVNSVAYQKGKPDAFLHFYQYDAENRLTDVYSSADSITIEHEAHYTYYKHGPLARTLLGNNQVQGMDYAYTLQGWLKSVNGSTLNPTNDMGQDGNTAVQTQQYIGRDAYGYSLHYFEGDYYPINGSTFLTGLKSPLGTGYKGLYNGNISSMAVNIGTFAAPKLYNYTYDQLNRLTKMDGFNGTNTGLNLWTGGLTASTDYQAVSYDANGNIKTCVRNGYGSTLAMDNLTYNYQSGTNKLTSVSDAVAAANYSTDIDNQAANNYSYDQAGNMLTDVQAGITGMSWSVYGKLLSVTKSNGTISYQYDATGNRISKTAAGVTTWYVRDAQGNILTTYSGTNLPLQEQDLYGSSRLGTIASPTALPLTAQYLDNLGSGTLYAFNRGKKMFELPNHLGNVLATISDKKYGTPSGVASQVSYYTADVKSAQDYYPGGMLQPGRTFVAGTGYRYGFNGKEKDAEDPVQYDYGFRIYDPRLVRFKSTDPLSKSYPWVSSYSYAEGDVLRAIDLDGLEKVIVNTVSFAPFDYFGSDPWGTYVGNGNNRRFGDNISSTVVNGTKIENYKIRGEATLDLTTMKETSHTAVGSSANYLAYAPGPFQVPLRNSKTKFANASFEDFYSGSAPGYSGITLGLDYHLVGANAAAPSFLPSTDVDVNVKINFWKTSKNKEIGVNGTVMGDKFPSNENYLVDERENKLFLGVSGINSENADNAPYTELPGNNKRPMSSFYFTILFNDDKSFKGVRTPNGKEYNLADWNKQFTNLNPKSSKTGTTVGSSTSGEQSFEGNSNW